MIEKYPFINSLFKEFTELKLIYKFLKLSELGYNFYGSIHFGQSLKTHLEYSTCLDCIPVKVIKPECKLILTPFSLWFETWQLLRIKFVYINIQIKCQYSKPLFDK